MQGHMCPYSCHQYVTSYPHQCLGNVPLLVAALTISWLGICHKTLVILVQICSLVTVVLCAHQLLSHCWEVLCQDCDNNISNRSHVHLYAKV